MTYARPHPLGVRTRALAGLAALVLILAGCGGGDNVVDSDGAGESSADGDSNGDGSSDDGTSGSDDGGGTDQDGFVTVDGTSYGFTYDNFGRCGVEADAGAIVSFGSLLDDPTRQVTFTYGLPEETDSGEPLMQVIVMDEDGGHAYYSAVGYSGIDPVGSVETITRNGSTVRITGQLRRNADGSLVNFEAEATCDQ